MSLDVLIIIVKKINLFIKNLQFQLIVLPRLFYVGQLL